MGLNMKPKRFNWDIKKKKSLTKESQALDNVRGHLGFFSIGGFEEWSNVPIIPDGYSCLCFGLVGETKPYLEANVSVAGYK